ncbi:MAG: hypothetical protein GQ570_08530 [Helicobacteraceae bacterium]|nr:hypothetical protein [Helicobacteraceae bacterium]
MEQLEIGDLVHVDLHEEDGYYMNDIQDIKRSYQGRITNDTWGYEVDGYFFLQKGYGIEITLVRKHNHGRK